MSGLSVKNRLLYGLRKMLGKEYITCVDEKCKGKIRIPRFRKTAQCQSCGSTYMEERAFEKCLRNPKPKDIAEAVQNIPENFGRGLAGSIGGSRKR